MRCLVCFCLFFWMVFGVQAQSPKDTLLLTDGTLLVGQVKSMERGVLKMDVPFSENIIEVKWNSISKLSSNQKFLMTIGKGIHYEGRIIKFQDEEIEVLIEKPSKRQTRKQQLSEGDTLSITPKDFILFYEINDSFLSRFNGEVSMGFNLARSNKLRQYSLRSSAVYNANSWAIRGNLNVIRSKQEQANTIERFDGGLTGMIYLPKEWFVIGWVNFLSNSQQLVELRVDSKVGLGKFLINRSDAVWMFQAGINLNNEEFMNELPANRSSEGVLATSISLNNLRGFDVLMSMIFYDSFSTKNRVRSDIRLDVKYDFFKDFFVKVGTSVNYDSRPTTGATDLDYVVQSTLGWKF